MNILALVEAFAVVDGGRVKLTTSGACYLTTVDKVKAVLIGTQALHGQLSAVLSTSEVADMARVPIASVKSPLSRLRKRGLVGGMGGRYSFRAEHLELEARRLERRLRSRVAGGRRPRRESVSRAR